MTFLDDRLRLCRCCMIMMAAPDERHRLNRCSSLRMTTASKLPIFVRKIVYTSSFEV